VAKGVRGLRCSWLRVPVVEGVRGLAYPWPRMFVAQGARGLVPEDSHGTCSARNHECYVFEIFRIVNTIFN